VARATVHRHRVFGGAGPGADDRGVGSELAPLAVARGEDRLVGHLCSGDTADIGDLAEGVTQEAQVMKSQRRPRRLLK
jgi:hypothetical protein